NLLNFFDGDRKHLSQLLNGEIEAEQTGNGLINGFSFALGFAFLFTLCKNILIEAGFLKFGSSYHRFQFLQG
ncbi:MAG: hypothetical protein AAGG02_09235, partial [Cyanobacteria bacterium P01_H01_bin.15]